MDETIKVTGLSKSYAGNKVISNIELSIGTGQVFGLLGANGAGKTTTIECAKKPPAFTGKLQITRIF